jgi:polysaccharide deacetylase 2 family uncharacterized protein YibQ
MTPISYPNAQGLLITRDAHEALAVLKKLVDSAEEKIRLAERETIAVAIGHRKDDDPLKTLRDAADTLQSLDFETAVSVVREKMQVAVEWHLNLNN